MAVPESPHFVLKRLTEGVFAALALDSSAATCNTGIVDLGDRTLVFDTFLTPKAGADLRRAAEALFDRPVAFVINSHYHNDHIRGTQAFDGSLVLATERTRELIATKGPEEMEWDRGYAPQRLPVWEERARTEPDPLARRQAAALAEYYRGIIESLPSVRLVLPQLTFDRHLIIRGTNRHVELRALAGHTPDDVIMLLPDDGIAFLADLLFVGFHPYLGDGDPDAWLQSLNTIERLAPATLVPGHGRPGTVNDVAMLRTYLDLVDQTAQDFARAGKVPDETIPIPEAFRPWGYGPFFPGNVKFVWERLTGGSR